MAIFQTFVFLIFHLNHTACRNSYGNAYGDFLIVK